MSYYTATEHIKEIIGFLNKNADYAVLRNFEVNGLRYVE